jgi:hypothetical protein
MRANGLMTAGTGILMAVGLTLADVRPAAACSCVPANLPATYNGSTDVFRGTVLFRIPTPQNVFYVARVHTTYKGCLQPGAVTLLVTAAQSATCGISIPTGVEYLFTANTGQMGLLNVGLCGFTVPFSGLSPAQLEFLDTRYNCCGKSCACVNSPLVSCFVDPCRVASCPEGTCRANYCGGCRAEFTSSTGAPVCAPCQANSDCPFGQSCTRGQCLPSF